MKIFFALLITGTIYCSIAHAQNKPARRVHFNFIQKDSIKLAFNDDFDLIEDSCSAATRYAHYNMYTRKFIGKIKDVSRLDPNIMVTEGTYSAAGEKEGPFVTHYLNGQLQAKGNFLKNKLDGKWELYYDDGKPKLFFEANGTDITITDYWDDKGLKLVDNGKGKYRVSMGTIYWEGKLLGGKPDGSWEAYNADDRSNTSLVSEKYKNGAFVKGKVQGAEYTDGSHMELIPTRMFPFINAERMHISAAACNDAKPRHIVRVQYKYGMDKYSDQVTAIVSNYLQYVDIKHFTDHFSIEGYVNDQGFLANLESFDSFSQAISQGLIMSLKRLPPLEPATIDGKAVKQKVKFSFTFTEGLYKYNYGFGEIMEK